MTCQEVLDLLYDVIDNEASDVDVAEVKQHLAACKNCADVFRLEHAVDELLKLRLNDRATPACTDALKTKVLNELDKIDSGHSGETHSRPATVPMTRQPAFRISRLMAVAASVIIVLGASYLGYTLYNHEIEYSPLEKAHLAIVGQFHNPGDAAEIDDVRSEVSRLMSYEVDHSVNGFKLIHALKDTVDGVELAHFVFTRDNQTVSVFVASAGDVPIPSDLMQHKVVRDHLEFYDHHCPGCRLVYHISGNCMIITATSEKDVDLLDFVPGRNIV